MFGAIDASVFIGNIGGNCHTFVFATRASWTLQSILAPQTNLQNHDFGIAKTVQLLHQCLFHGMGPDMATSRYKQGMEGLLSSLRRCGWKFRREFTGKLGRKLRWKLGWTFTRKLGGEGNWNCGRMLCCLCPRCFRWHSRWNIGG